HWGHFIEQFQHALPGCQLIALDLPGNGQLNQERSPVRVQDMVTHCRAQLAVRSIKPPYHVLAMSLGAMVAVAWAHAHPQEVATNVLINTSMRPFSPFYQRLQPANYRELLALAVLGATPERWERTILRLTSNQTSDAVVPHWLTLRRENPVSRVNALRQLIAAARFRAPLRRPPAPTLVLASEQDHLVHVECSRALARHWQCALRIHPSAGHDLPLDDGPWVAAQVRDWQREQFPSLRTR
ncbi:MAG: alpha/beta hydrolase, partial [Rhodoferax sp.]|nr:alpha/beta hydrolase [Rhodoferax sp.]